jgi:hypothetical protein
MEQETDDSAVVKDTHINRALMRSIMGMHGNHRANTANGSVSAADDDSHPTQYVGESDAPLTTRAMRDLQKAKKERVYTKVLIRVR